MCKQTVRLSRQSGKPPYIMPTKPLAAEASSTDVVFKTCLLLHDAFQASICQSICFQAATMVSNAKLKATLLMMSRRQSLRDQISPKTDFTINFQKCWATSMAKLWAWRVHLGFVWTSPAGGASAKEMSSTRRRRRRRHQPLLRHCASSREDHSGEEQHVSP